MTAYTANTSSEILQSDRNAGLDLLKTLACIVVIVVHFGDSAHITSFSRILYILKPYAVPTFMLVSFWLISKGITSASGNLIAKRCRRILYPFIGWALILFLIYALTDFKALPALVQSLGWQLATGHSPELNPPLWFLWILLLLTITFLSIHARYGNTTPVILSLLSIMALIMQYSGLNEWLFSSLRFELAYPLGRIAEMLPLAGIGFLVGYYGLDKALCKRKWVFPLLLILTWQFIRILWKLEPSTVGYGYAGLNKAIIAVFLSMTFVTMPIPGFVGPIIQYISRYNLGVYCLHWPVGLYIVTHIKPLAELSAGPEEVILFGMIFTVCWSLCFVIDRFGIPALSKLVR